MKQEKNMTAEELLVRYGMEPHVENGSFIRLKLRENVTEREPSGAIYYYVGPEEISEFHTIDCDEYWCYVTGSPLEIWMIDPEGKLSVKKLGIGEDSDPLVFLPVGVTFASRHPRGTEGGTFVSCITAPRFTFDGFTLFPREEMLEKYPALRTFYEV